MNHIDHRQQIILIMLRNIRGPSKNGKRMLGINRKARKVLYWNLYGKDAEV